MKLKASILAAAVTAAPVLLAHAGHDHNAWTAGLIHVVGLVSLIGVAYVGYRFFTTKKMRQENS